MTLLKTETGGKVLLDSIVMHWPIRQIRGV